MFSSSAYLWSAEAAVERKRRMEMLAKSGITVTHVVWIETGIGFIEMDAPSKEYGDDLVKVAIDKGNCMSAAVRPVRVNGTLPKVQVPIYSKESEWQDMEYETDGV